MLLNVCPKRVALALAAEKERLILERRHAGIGALDLLRVGFRRRERQQVPQPGQPLLGLRLDTLAAWPRVVAAVDLHQRVAHEFDVAVREDARDRAILAILDEATFGQDLGERCPLIGYPCRAQHYEGVLALRHRARDVLGDHSTRPYIPHQAHARAKAQSEHQVALYPGLVGLCVRDEQPVRLCHVPPREAPAWSLVPAPP
ncbi:MAG TPA: hypothetical protein VNM90_20440 [Haliangium sp.]|nr:hypothetical protein [Haliangium sp.]